MKPEKELNRQDKKARITKKVVVAVKLGDDIAGGNSVEIGSVTVDVSSDAVSSVCNTFSFCDFVSINFNSKSPPQTSTIPPI